MKSIYGYLTLILILSISISDLYSKEDPLLEKGRQLYYEALEEEQALLDAIETFKILAKQNSSLKVTAKTYIGSLTAMKALYTVWPNKKYTVAIDGIDIMEEALKKSPDNVEALFIYGTTCYHLPFFFGMADEAETALKKIPDLLEKKTDKVNPEIAVNALKFILEELDLSKAEESKIKKLIYVIESKDRAKN